MLNFKGVIVINVISDSNTAINRVYHQLRQKIIKGEFSPGEKLKVERLKTIFETGASPIREALSLLSSESLVERIEQRGFRVSPISKEHFTEILMLRCKLDSLALKLSIELGDNQWEERLVLNHYRLSKANLVQFDQWEVLHRIFHISLLEACDSPILLNYCSQLYDQNIRYRFLAEHAINYGARQVRNEHQLIFDAVLDKDVFLASDLLQKHYRETGAFLIEQLNKVTSK
jgi:DNA-binding GntR family transcriptional regulator